MKAVVLFLSIWFLISGCNYQKRIQKVRKQFDEIGRDWSLEHPCPPTIAISDTTYITDSSDLKRYAELIRSLQDGDDAQTESQFALQRELYLKDESFKRFFDSMLTHPVTIIKTIHITDSIPDKRTEDVLRKTIQEKDVALAGKDSAISEANKSKRAWLFTSLSLITLLLITVGIKIASLFKVKLPL